MNNPSNQSDRELFLQISRGDERAFHTLFHKYNQQLLPYGIKLTGSASSAEEVLQQVFIKIWLNREKLDTVQEPRAWIVRIVSNESINYLRKQALEGRLLRTLQATAAQHSISPGEVLDGKDVAQAIQNAVSALSPQVQKVYRLSKEQGLSIAEIAEQLELSPNTIKNQLVIALKKIRAYVERTVLVFLTWLLSGF